MVGLARGTQDVNSPPDPTTHTHINTIDIDQHSKLNSIPIHTLTTDNWYSICSNYLSDIKFMNLVKGGNMFNLQNAFLTFENITIQNFNWWNLSI